MAKREISSDQFRKRMGHLVRHYRIRLDCGHRFCFHNLSNTLVIHPDGKMECSECYQAKGVTPYRSGWLKLVARIENPVAPLNEKPSQSGNSARVRVGRNQS